MSSTTFTDTVTAYQFLFFFSLFSGINQIREQVGLQVGSEGREDHGET